MKKAAFRRIAVYPALLLAAAASLATSNPNWELHDAAKGLSDILSVAKPEATHHFTVTSSQSHVVRLNGQVEWDVNPSAIVHITIQKDDGSVPAETDVIAGEAQDVGDGYRANTTLSLGMADECKSSCDTGYTVTIQLTQATPIEQVKVDFSFDAAIQGDGDQPKGAAVKVTKD